MLKRARILLAGTAVATALSSVAASSQSVDGPVSSRVVNGQLQIGDIFAGQRLNVIDPADGVALHTGAQGNAVELAVEGEGARLRSDQRLQGRVEADGDVVIHGYTPEIVAVTAAIGNSATTAVVDGSLGARAEQAIGVDGWVSARTRVSAEPSTTGDTSALAAAVGNDQSHGANGAFARIRAGQYHYGSGTTARVDATLAHVQGQADMLATASANQTLVEAASDEVGLGATQVSTGSTQALVRGDVRNGYLVNGTASAAANSVTLANAGAVTKAKVNQDHAGYVRAESALYVGQFGGVSSAAHGAGNTVSAVAYGDTLTLDTDQLNSGGVDAAASFDGREGYDADVTASAYGNAVSAQACSDCDGVLDTRNAQNNGGDVSAVTRVDVGGGRYVQSNATAMGNSASYVVSRPSH